jgi:hypothetical protein
MRQQMTQKKWFIVFLLGTIALAILTIVPTIIVLGVLFVVTVFLWAAFITGPKRIHTEHYQGEKPLSTSYRRYEGL